jgi:hypothetical protein
VAAALVLAACARIGPPPEPPLVCGPGGRLASRAWPDGRGEWCTGADGRREGPARLHSRDFRVDGGYHDDRPAGRWLAWWPSGDRAGELDFEAGVPHGRLLAWYENGRKLAEGAFVNGRVGTPVVFYDARGRARYRLDAEAADVMNGHALDERGTEVTPDGEWLPRVLPEAYDLLVLVLTLTAQPER